MIATQTGTAATATITILPNGETVMSSNDPLYRFLRAAAELFIAGEIDIEELQDIESRWSTVYKPGVGSFMREIACPAARKILGSIALAWMEPDCLCDIYREKPCGCLPMDRRERLRELIGGPL